MGIKQTEGSGVEIAKALLAMLHRCPRPALAGGLTQREPENGLVSLAWLRRYSDSLA